MDEAWTPPKAVIQPDAAHYQPTALGVVAVVETVGLALLDAQRRAKGQDTGWDFPAPLERQEADAIAGATCRAMGELGIWDMATPEAVADRLRELEEIGLFKPIRVIATERPDGPPDGNGRAAARLAATVNFNTRGLSPGVILDRLLTALHRECGQIATRLGLPRHPEPSDPSPTVDDGEPSQTGEDGCPDAPASSAIWWEGSDGSSDMLRTIAGWFRELSRTDPSLRGELKIKGGVVTWLGSKVRALSGNTEAERSFRRYRIEAAKSLRLKRGDLRTFLEWHHHYHAAHWQQAEHAKVLGIVPPVVEGGVEVSLESLELLNIAESCALALEAAAARVATGERTQERWWANREGLRINLRRAREATETSQDAPAAKWPELKAHDRQAWQLATLHGMTQDKVALALNKEHGTTYTQGQVSRMIARAKAHADANGLSEKVAGPIDRPRTVDPGRLELGARVDKRNPRPSDMARADDDDE